MSTKDVNFYRGDNSRFISPDFSDKESGDFFYNEDTGDIHVLAPDKTLKCMTKGAEITTYEVEVGTSWSGDSSAGWSQSITVDGIKSTDEPIVDVVLDNESVNSNKKALEAWAKVSHIITTDGNITVYSYATKAPNTDFNFNIQLKVVK